MKDLCRGGGEGSEDQVCLCLLREIGLVVKPALFRKCAGERDQVRREYEDEKARV